MMSHCVRKIYVHGYPISITRNIENNFNMLSFNRVSFISKMISCYVFFSHIYKSCKGSCSHSPSTQAYIRLSQLLHTIPYNDTAQALNMSGIDSGVLCE